LQGYVEVAKRLIKHDADVDALDHYLDTPLLVATKARQGGVARVLLEAGANMWHKDLIGGYAFVYPQLEKHTELINMYLEFADLQKQQYEQLVAAGEIVVGQHLEQFSAAPSPQSQAAGVFDQRDHDLGEMAIVVDAEHERHHKEVSNQHNRLGKQEKAELEEGERATRPAPRPTLSATELLEEDRRRLT
jgi:hypothetical protein